MARRSTNPYEEHFVGARKVSRDTDWHVAGKRKAFRRVTQADLAAKALALQKARKATRAAETALKSTEAQLRANPRTAHLVEGVEVSKDADYRVSQLRKKFVSRKAADNAAERANAQYTKRTGKTYAKRVGKAKANPRPNPGRTQLKTIEGHLVFVYPDGTAMVKAYGLIKPSEASARAWLREHVADELRELSSGKKSV
jgi:hypothetical protein